MASVTTVAQISIPLMEDYKNPFKDNILRVALEKDNLHNYTDVIIESSLNSLTTNLENYRKFGVTKFIDGLPSGTERKGEIDTALLDSAITQIEGEPVTIVLTVIAPQDMEAALIAKITSENGYNAGTGILANHSFNTTNDVVFDFIDVTSVELYNSSLYSQTATLFVLVDSVSTEYVTLSNYASAFYESLIPLTIKITYTLDSNPSVEKEWVYISGGGYPLIDQVIAGEGVQDHYPVVTIREEGVNVIDSGDQERIDSTAEILQIIGIDFTDLSQEITDGESIEVIEDAHVFISTDMDSGDQDVRSYLFDYFDRVRIDNPNAKTLYDDYIAGSSNVYTNINYSLTERSLKYLMRLNYVETEVTTSIGPSIGFISKELRKFGTSKGYETSEIIFTKQLTSTTAMRMTIHGLSTESTIGTSRKSIVRINDMGDNDSDKTLVVPLSRNLINNMSPGLRSIVIAASVQLNIYAVSIQKLEWYQTKIFKIVLTIVAIVVSIVWPNPFILQLAAGITSSAFIWLVYVLFSFAISAALASVAKIIADQIGGKLALVIAAIAIAYSVFSGDFELGSDILISGENLLKYGQALIEGVSASLQEDLKDIVADYVEKQEVLEKAYESLEEYDSLFDDDLNIYDDVVTPTFVNNFNEHPDVFYDRTSDLDFTLTGTNYQLDNYHDIMVELPEFN